MLIAYNDLLEKVLELEATIKELHEEMDFTHQCIVEAQEKAKRYADKNKMELAAYVSDYLVLLRRDIEGGIKERDAIG